MPPHPDATAPPDSTQEESSPRGRDIALGLTRDALPLANRVSDFLFDASAWGARVGFGVGDAVMGAASTAALTTAASVAALGAAGVVGGPVVAGVCVGAAAVKAGQVSLSAASWATQGSLSLGKRMASSAFESTDQLLEHSGVGSGSEKILRLAVGDEAADALAFMQAMCSDFAIELPPGMNWQQATTAARGLAWLQHAAGVLAVVTPVAPPPDALEWTRIRRCMRFALGAFGHLALRALRVLPMLDEHRSDVDAIGALVGVRAEDVIHAEWASTTYRPGHYVVIDHAQSAVVLAVRGTMRLQDVLTDLVCEQVDLSLDWVGAEGVRDETDEWHAAAGRSDTGAERAAAGASDVPAGGAAAVPGGDELHDAEEWFEPDEWMEDMPTVPQPEQPVQQAAAGTAAQSSGSAAGAAAVGVGTGRAHGGMLRAARRLQHELLGDGGEIDAALRAHPGYALVLTGHSLGAGVTSLLAALLGPQLRLAGEEAPRRVVCYAFAPPAVLSVELARLATHVTSVVESSDVVPRFVRTRTIRAHADNTTRSVLCRVT